MDSCSKGMASPCYHSLDFYCILAQINLGNFSRNKHGLDEERLGVVVLSSWSAQLGCCLWFIKLHFGHFISIASPVKKTLAKAIGKILLEHSTLIPLLMLGNGSEMKCALESTHI